MSPSWSKLFKEIFNLFAPTSWKPDASAWTGWNNCPTSRSLVNIVRLVEISAADVAKFTDICRARQTTLTAAFHGLGVSVISQLIAGHPSAAGMSTLSTGCPISLRSATNVGNDTFADHVTALRAYPSINPSFSWEYASEYASQLRAGVLACREEVGMLKYLFGDYEGFFKSKLGAKRGAALEVSNLGRISDFNPPDGKWGIEETVFGQSDVVVGSLVKLNITGTGVGGITMCLNASPDAMDESVRDRFLDLFTSGFRELLKQ
jgi:hypothetical protein